MLTHAQKELALEAIRENGTLQAGAKAAGCDVKALNNEMRRSVVFKKRVQEAREEGRRNIADKAITKIKEYAFSPPLKTDRNQLTAAIALANAFEPGFKGSTTVQGKIEHDVKVITAVPRPKYEEVEAPKPKQLLPAKKKRVIKDDNGNYLGTVEEVIEGEVIREE